MIKAGQISKGMFLKFKNEPYLVADREFVNPGKGTAFVRLKLKSLMSGAVLRQTVKSQESVEDIIVEEKKAQFLYMDNDDYHFMDNETFEQYEIPIEGMERQKKGWGNEVCRVKLVEHIFAIVTNTINMVLVQNRLK